MNKTITVPLNEKTHKAKLHILTDNDYSSLLETIELLNDKKQLLRIEKAIKNISKGKVFSHKNVFGHTQPNL